MVKVSFLGSCREIGRSAILIESEKSKDSILLDYGIKMTGTDDNFPEHVSGKDLSAIVVTHSHIDHVGGVPIFYISGSVPLYMTELTYEVSEILLKDMMNISDFYLPFEKQEIIKMKRNTRFLNYRNRSKVGENTYITLFNNGHIPGSAMVYVEMDDKKILYTSDFNSNQTMLMSPAVPPAEHVDMVITESTYGNSDHEPRQEVEKKFVENVNRILDNDGRVLVPAFGVSRSQEILMVLNKYGVNYPIFVDGMARRIARIYDTYNSFFRSWSEMTSAFDKSHFIVQKNRFHERENAKHSKGVIVAPSGMLKGGTARMYAESMIKDPNSAIFLVSYQIPDSPGAQLLNEQKYVTNTKDTEIKEDALCEIQFFDFSSHSGKTQLMEFIERCQFNSNEEKNVFVVHGDEDNALAFTDELNKHGFNAKAPKQAEEFHI